MDLADLDGLRFKLTGDGSSGEMASMKAGGRKYRLVEEDATTAEDLFVLPAVDASAGGAEFGAARKLTRRVTLMRKPRTVGDDGGEGAAGGTPAKEGGKTPGGKEKKKKRDKGDKDGGKTPKKAKN